MHFQVVDANEPLPFDPRTFDALVCTEAIVHFPDRLPVLKDWFRILKPGARLLYTDGGVVTGAISTEETRMRSPGYLFIFVPSGLNEILLEQAGFRVVHCEDVTEHAIQVSERAIAAYQRRHDELVKLDGQSSVEAVLSVFDLVRRLGSEQRLSRMVYVAKKPTA